MATGGKNQELDSRVTCSVCLEPYSGRQPKLLPCFHTFCLPCLSELAEASQTKGTAVAGEEQSEETQAASITITCPACRKPTPVPPGGVAYFQSNFYIDDGGTGPQPSPCQLCEGDQEASYECSKCGKFCSQCHRIHNKFCSSTHVTAISVATTDSGMLMLEEKVKNQIKVIQTAVEQLKEDKRKIDRQRQGIEEELNSRYLEGIHLLAEARDECLKSIRERAEAVKNQLQTEIDDAEKVGTELSTLSLRSPKTPDQSSPKDIQKGLLSDADLMKFKDVKIGNKCNLTYSYGQPMASSFDGCCKSFIDTVVISDGIPETTSAASAVAGQLSNHPCIHHVDSVFTSPGNCDEHVKSDDHTHCVKLSDFLQKMDALQSELKTVKHYEQTASSLQSELKTVKQKNVDLSSDVLKLQKEMTSHRDTVKLLEREETSVKDKNSLLCQDMAALQGQVRKFDGDVTALKTKNQQVSFDVSKAQKELGNLRTEMSHHGTTLNTVKSQIVKATTQIAFHALLHTQVKVKTRRVLILKDAVVNIGGGYSTQTGYFTAPVSGLYIFMATSRAPDKDQWAKLDIMHEEENIAYLCGSGGTDSCSCHVAVKMAAGERVYLRTFNPADQKDSVSEYHYEGGWLTSFTGALIQPDL